MKRLSRTVLLASLLALLFGVPHFSATLDASIDLARWVADADVIVIGKMRPARIDDGRGQSQVAGRRIDVEFKVGTIVVERWLKGNDGSTELSVALINAPGRAYDFVQPQTLRMFFLKRVGNRLEFVDHERSSIPASSDVPEAGGTLLERVSRAASGPISSTQASSRERLESIEAIASLKAPSAIGHLREALNDPDERVRLSASAHLIQKNDVSTLSLAEKVLMTPVARRNEAERDLAWTYRWAISLYLHDSAAVPMLKRLLASGDIDTRRTAAEALSNSDSESAIPPLAEALSDNDILVQYFAVCGLARLTGESERRTNRDLWMSKRDYLVGYWTDWARTRRIIK